MLIKKNNLNENIYLFHLDLLKSIYQSNIITVIFCYRFSGYDNNWAASEALIN